MRRLFVVLATASALAASCVSREPPPPPAEPRCPRDGMSAVGDATHYDASGAGRCSFEASPDRLVAAIAGADYAHAAWCGACLAVAGPLGEVIVRVVDRCSGCKHGDLDLSREAFARIAPTTAGRVRVAWREVGCPVDGPIAYQRKPGSNAQWTAIQLRNHRYAIGELAVRDAGGSYRALFRGDDNYFVARGLGDGPVALRVTDAYGHALEDTGAVLGDGPARPGASQFASCP